MHSRSAVEAAETAEAATQVSMARPMQCFKQSSHGGKNRRRRTIGALYSQERRIKHVALSHLESPLVLKGLLGWAEGAGMSPGIMSSSMPDGPGPCMGGMIGAWAAWTA